ncbi:hypothetical protein F2P56_036394 [Juglans regia]|uniref:Uncharacterized protein n=1 Tax=Juglans regia TaxID=51240 RepID=A0A833T6U3_JUGRE|nr:hypothetical protein F2P56_036394 [Juglans regia]
MDKMKSTLSFHYLLTEFIRNSVMIELIIILIIIIRKQMEGMGDCSCTGGCRANLMPLRLFLKQEKAQTQSEGTNTKENEKKRGKKDVELPLFSYESISAATDNFSLQISLEKEVLDLSTRESYLRGRKLQ